MSLIPPFELGLWNAWIFVLSFLLLFIVFSVLDHLRGKKDSSRPDKPPFNEKEEKLYGISQLAILASNIYSVFFPLKLNTARAQNSIEPNNLNLGSIQQNNHALIKRTSTLIQCLQRLLRAHELS